MKFKRRIGRVAEYLVENGFDGMICTNPESVFYLTNAPFVTGSAGKALYISKDGKASLVVSSLDYEEACDRSEGAEIVKMDLGEPLFERLRKVAGGAEKVGFEDDFVTVRSYRALKKKFSLTEIGTAIEKMREVKDPEELERIEAALGASDRAAAKTISNLRDGMTEIEAASELEYHMRREGGESLAFETIFASGPRRSTPTACRARGGRPEARRSSSISGSRPRGYCSDTTRTFFFGQPRDEMVKVYDIVLEAQNAAISAARAGITGKELDGVARAVIEGQGYGKFFVHGTGHGVGIAVHEGLRSIRGMRGSWFPRKRSHDRARHIHPQGWRR
jgi:Xaa-Pro aminopeptidase